MKWITYVQRRLTVTRAEGIALTALSGLFLTGICIQYLWVPEVTIPDGYYAATDSVFEARVREAKRAAPTGAPGAAYDDTTDTTEQTRDTSEAAARHSPRGRVAVRMDLNQANARQLQQISGIGPVLAGRILDYRRLNGPFLQVDDLTAVSGIGPKTLASVRQYLFVNRRASETSEPADSSVGRKDSTGGR